MAALRLMVKHGVSPTLKDNEVGLSALHVAAVANRVNAARYLIEEAKGSLDIRNFDFVAPLGLAAYAGSVNVVRYLIDHGTLIDAKSKHGGTPLRAAADQGYVNVVRLLLSRGADPKFRDIYGKTPRHYAQKNGHAAVAEVLRAAEHKP